MDERNNHQYTESHSYENGSTQPPKNRGGIIVLIICLCIVVGGIISTATMSGKLSLPQIGIPGTVIFSDSDNAGGTVQPAPSLPAPSVPSSEDQPQMELKPLPEQVDNVPQTGGMGLQDIYDKCIPSVVSITCTLSNGKSSGTGVVLSKNGYLVTNAHVIDDATQIQVLLTDGRTMAASIVGADSLSDLAVLYVDAQDLVPAEFGDSSQLRVGDAVVAIGDPLGVSLRGTMTDGIVSAINRGLQTDGRTMTLVQTNAALNSGNSGGPLINCHGQVIGINTMKIGTFADSAGVEGLGFAIPSATVKEVVDQLITQGYVSGRPVLPVSGEWVSLFNQQFRRMPAGLYITDTADHSTIKAKDILLSINGTRVTTQEELDAALYSYHAGTEVTAVLYRNAQQYTTTLILKESGT
ncbi:MAG: trypsin-like serine protease [Ruminococcaceae bacterium]|nr:trypsin-like serine protease [Oscillospiraceae bacterium]